MLKEQYVKSPINYIGNKYKLVKEIIPRFPDKISMFVDVFGGSGTVLLNVVAEHYVYNDINNYIADIFEGLISQDPEETVRQIQAVIDEYALSKTNRDGFEKLRRDYNNGRNDWISLYTLMCYSFNYQFRFNSDHQYNSSFGKDRSCFSVNQKRNIMQMKKHINTDVVIMRESFTNIDYSDFDENDLLYFDPPYFNSVGNYNDGKRGFEGWTEEHEKQLLKLLDELNDRGVRFALSNNLKYENQYLNEWKNKYKVHYLNGDYSNCNYQKIDKSKDIEVLITNY